MNMAMRLPLDFGQRGNQGDTIPISSVASPLGIVSLTDAQ